MISQGELRHTVRASILTVLAACDDQCAIVFSQALREFAHFEFGDSEDLPHRCHITRIDTGQPSVFADGDWRAKLVVERVEVVSDYDALLLIKGKTIGSQVSDLIINVAVLHQSVVVCVDRGNRAVRPR